MITEFDHELNMWRHTLTAAQLGELLKEHCERTGHPFKVPCLVTIGDVTWIIRSGGEATSDNGNM